MRYEKEINFPRRQFTVHVKTAAELLKADGFSLRHLYLDGDAFTHSWGRKFVATVGEGCDRLYAYRGKLFTYATDLARLYRIGDAKTWDGVREEPSMLLPTKYFAKDEEGFWTITPSRLSLLHGNTASHYSLKQGGVAGAVHKERLCYVAGQTLYYSQAYEQAPFENADSDPNGYGYVELLRPEAGNFIGMTVYDDELYLFREQGIDKFIMDYDVLNHKAYPVPYGGKEIVQGSIVHCGDKVLFLAGDGMYSLDGSSVQLVDTELVKKLDVSSPVQAGVWGDLYCVFATLKGGGKALFVYDRKRGYSFDTGIEAEAFACADEAYYRIGNRIYRLSENAPLEGKDSEISFQTDTKEGEVLWIAVRGKGAMQAEISCRGQSRTLELTADKKAFLPRPLLSGGTLSVRIFSSDPLWRFSEFAFGLAEVAS